MGQIKIFRKVFVEIYLNSSLCSNFICIIVFLKNMHIKKHRTNNTIFLAAIPNEAIEQRNIDENLKKDSGESWNFFKPHLDLFSSVEVRDAQAQTDEAALHTAPFVSSIAPLVQTDEAALNTAPFVSSIAPLVQTDEAALHTAPFVSSIAPLVHSSTQTLLENKPLVRSTSSQTMMYCVDACAQTELPPLFNYIPVSNNEIVNFQGKLKERLDNPAIIETDSIKRFGPVVKESLATIKPKKKNSAFSRGTVIAKRSRKVPPSKALKQLLSRTRLNVVASASAQIAVSNRVFSGAPVFNSIAPSQHPSSNFPALPGNVFVYRGHQGIPITIPYLPQPQLNARFALNPRIVISPMPVMNSPEQGSSIPNLNENLLRNIRPTFYPLQVQTSGELITDHSVKNSEAEADSDSEQSKLVAKVFSTENLFSFLRQQSKKSDDLICKYDFAEENSFPVSDSLSYSLKKDLNKDHHLVDSAKKLYSDKYSE